MQPTLEQMITWARRAGEILRAGFEQEHTIEYKGRINLVTEMDHRAEAYLLSEIQGAFPEHTILTEESGLLQGASGQCWYVDPLDGTVNYAHAMPQFCVSIAYAEAGRALMGVVYVPMHDECYSAQRGQGAYLNGSPIHVSQASELIDSLLTTGFPYEAGAALSNNLANYQRFSYLTQGVRCMGSAAMDLAYVASGRLDAFWELSLEGWDIAAGGLIVEEAGGVVTSASGSSDYLEAPYSIVASNGFLHSQVLDVLHPSE